MKPVSQTTFGDRTGNCFTACVASILELPIDDVPNFCVVFGETEWWRELEKWLAPRGLAPLSFCLAGGEQADQKRLHDFFNGEGGFYVHKTVPLICSGKNADGIAHSVVVYWDYERGEIAVHDPNPKAPPGGCLVSYRDIIAFAAAKPGQPLPPLTGEEPSPKVETMPCAECGGSGRAPCQAEVNCDPCGGSGRVPLAAGQPKDDDLAKLLDELEVKRKAYEAADKRLWNNDYQRAEAVWNGDLRAAYPVLRAAARRALPDKRQEE